jgi:hypothetical protein
VRFHESFLSRREKVVEKGAVELKSPRAPRRPIGAHPGPRAVHEKRKEKRGFSSTDF